MEERIVSMSLTQKKSVSTFRSAPGREMESSLVEKKYKLTSILLCFRESSRINLDHPGGTWFIATCDAKVISTSLQSEASAIEDLKLFNPNKGKF
jgi:hypothetical protein